MTCSVPSCTLCPWHGDAPFCETDTTPNPCWKQAVYHKPHPDEPDGTFVCALHKED